jgi:hypothetical protein
MLEKDPSNKTQSANLTLMEIMKVANVAMAWPIRHKYDLSA